MARALIRVPPFVRAGEVFEVRVLLQHPMETGYRRGSDGEMLPRELVRRGSIFQSTSDTEVIIHLVATSSYRTLLDRFIDALKQVEGAYSLICMTPEGMIACRDPLGVRPLVMGKLGDAIIFASETVAFDVVGADYVRSIDPGELVIVTGSGEVRSHRPFGDTHPRPCIFEHVYFSRPDSIVDGSSVYSVRKAIGAQLALENPVEADYVIPVPDSGVPAAIGYAQQSGIPFELGIIRSHYIGRTFIQPGDKVRHLGVKLKHNANRALISGKRIVLIDDSIVRGTTSLKIVQMMRDAGAREVHFRIASPPIKHPDYYGIDMPEQDKLLAAGKEAQVKAALAESTRSISSRNQARPPAALSKVRNSYRPVIAGVRVSRMCWMSLNSSVLGMGAADRYCIWSSMSENADFSFSAFLISSAVT